MFDGFLMGDVFDSSLRSDIFIAHRLKKIFSSVRSGMYWRQHISLLTELSPVDDGQAINISLLKELSSRVRLPRLTLIHRGPVSIFGHARVNFV
jgi:hypothetical protein